MIENDYSCINGLHDAEITDIIEVNLDYDYTERNPLRNYLEIKLDAKLAIMWSSTSVKAIRFYNYKIIKEDVNFINSWWQDSEFVELKGKTGLKIRFRFSKTDISEIIILFDKLEVVKK